MTTPAQLSAQRRRADARRIEGDVTVPAEPTETAWKIQSAVADATAKADSKAALALTLQSTTLAVLSLLASSRRAAGGFDSVGAQTLLWLGVALLMAGACCAAWAVSPRLGKERRGPEPDSDFLYFGHLRLMEPDALERALRATDPLPSLTRQVVVMSEIAWAKHRRVQCSFMLAVAGCGFFAAATAFA
ncbi:Pycsar system effector family protein [Streptomyces filamentosus]|uniref:Pycsar system effector family protein n=1 Tax=Streptomyces filamentosus TaxID=67294 RepID=UPI0033D04A04